MAESTAAPSPTLLMTMAESAAGPRLVKMTIAKDSVDSTSARNNALSVDAGPRQERLLSGVSFSHETALAVAQSTQQKTVAIARHPHFQVIAISTAGGTIMLSAIGGAFGCMGGMVAGSVAGTVPALLTFGTSIPLGAVMGGAIGAPLGACAGGLAGAAAGGAAGHGVYTWRAEIKDGVLRIRLVTADKAQQLKLALTPSADSARDFTVERTSKLRSFTLESGKKAGEVALAAKKRGHEVVTSKRFKATAASATAGAAAGGVAGGTAGTVVGAGVGGLIGLPAALFTFGLSVPFCAFVGGGLGCAAGATSGSTAGGVAGGATGYGAHKYRNEIADGANSAWRKALAGSNKLKVQARHSVLHVTALVNGTGGTTESKKDLALSEGVA